MLIGDDKFEVPQGGSLVIHSEAQYDTDVDIEAMANPSGREGEDTRPPAKYRIELYRVSESWRKGDSSVSTPREFDVGKSESSNWYNLEKGRYYVVIMKGGNPNFTLAGNLRIEIKPPESLPAK